MASSGNCVLCFQMLMYSQDDVAPARDQSTVNADAIGDAVGDGTFALVDEQTTNSGLWR